MDMQYSLEEGDVCKKAKSHSGGKFCLLTSLLLAAVGILALILVTAAYVRVQEGGGGGRGGEEGAEWRGGEQEKQTRDTPVVDPALQDEPMKQLEAMLGMGGITERHSMEQRAITAGWNSLDAGCISLVSPNSTEKPTAHIVPGGGGKCLVRKLIFGFKSFTVLKSPFNFTRPRRNSFSILSEQWNCGSKPIVRGHVQGGMVFNRSSGYLRLPVDGVYYIYSQVQFWSNTPVNKSIIMKYATVAIIPRSDQHEYKSTLNPRAQLESIGMPYAGPNIAATFNHGGLFHFPAGTQIGIGAFYDRKIDTNRGESLKFSATSEDTYMGAFLINETP